MDFDYVRDDVERSPQQAHLQHYSVRTEKDSGRWDSGGQDPGLGPPAGAEIYGRYRWRRDLAPPLWIGSRISRTLFGGTLKSTCKSERWSPKKAGQLEGWPASGYRL